MSLRAANVAVLALAALLPAAAHAAVPAQTAYWYSRISVDYAVQKNGEVRVDELHTFIFNRGNYHDAWRVIAVPAGMNVRDVTVSDGSTGRVLAQSETMLDGAKPESAGKYWVNAGTSTVSVAWYFETSDRVHTWVVHYTLRGAIGFLADRDEFAWTVFSGFGVPVDTVEVEVHFPGVVNNPEPHLFTTQGNDFYIDRPDQSTFRYRVSGIGIGDTVSLRVAVGKGLLMPPVFMPLRLTLYAHRYALGAGVLLVSILFVAGYLSYYQRTTVGRWARSIYRVPLYAKEGCSYLWSTIKEWYRSR